MSELDQIVEVSRWLTSDGKVHGSLGSAQYHATQMDRAATANAVLEAGGSVADALRAAKWEHDIPQIFERVTKATKLVISHWQCQETPGYQVQHFTPDWKVWVWGNAGSWSGCYGNNVPLQDLARYASAAATVGLKAA